MTAREGPVKLVKFLLLAGAASSRRACQRLLVEDRVSVNGQVVHQPSLDILPGRDTVCVDGRPVSILPRRAEPVYLMLNKPAGVLCTRRDDKGRPTVYDLIRRRDLRDAGLVTAGRLDYATKGLLFLSNDGEFIETLTHPRYRVPKHYIATVKGPVDPRTIRHMLRGVVDEGERLRFDEVHVVASGPHRSVLRIVLTEGKNREIRRVFRILRVTLKELVRIRIADFTLEGLPEGAFKLVKREHIARFLARYRTPEPQKPDKEDPR